ncbi:pirin family protein [Mangrovivirga cuniculi]|uniref:pirin family protein n=1 Tax=Mangrovivirga cuniculi TaxID=2715131 RepID=UPI00269BC176|nr:pirin family protein [Mangrovivirga cuniculi]
MKKVIHKSNSRGHADHGWLNSWHSFSFANYYNPERMHFGVLRVLNDDTVAPAMGFGKHPHDNMEIISIPLSGDLEHADNMGNKQVIKEGDVQVMSAGTGIMHSEKNKNNDQEVKFLQIWVFPNKKDVEPRYDQQSFKKKIELINGSRSYLLIKTMRESGFTRTPGLVYRHWKKAKIFLTKLKERIMVPTYSC